MALISLAGALRARATAIAAGAAAIAIVVLLGWALRLEHLRGLYRGLLDRTVIVLEEAGFDKPRLANTPANVALLGAQRRQFLAERNEARGRIDQQNASIGRLEADGRAARERAEANLQLYRETARQRNAWISAARSAATRTERLSAEEEVKECERTMDALYRDGF